MAVPVKVKIRCRYADVGCVTRFLAKFGGIASTARSIQIVEALRVFLNSVKPPHTFNGSGYYPSPAGKWNVNHMADKGSR